MIFTTEKNIYYKNKKDLSFFCKRKAQALVISSSFLTRPPILLAKFSDSCLL